MNKMTNEESLRKLNSLKDYAREFEEKNKDLLSMWNKYNQLGESEKKELTDKWEEYYQKVKTTPMYEHYIKVGEAFKLKNITKVKELSSETKNIKKVLSKPSSEDPKVLYNLLRNYFHIKSLIGEENKKSEVYEEALNIFF